MDENTNEEVVVTEPETEKQNSSFLGKVDDFFGITKSGSNFKTEIIAGLTTFMAMVYILMVNASMFSQPWVGPTYAAAYIATAIGAIIGTMLMAFLAKMPLAQASGMGINAFIVYTLLLNGTGLTYANCMVFTLLDGGIFLLLTLTGLRQKIFEAIPEAVRHAIPVGIGLFIAFIGMQNAGIIVNDDSTLVKFASFNILSLGNGVEFATYSAGTVGGILPALVAILGVLAIAIMSKKNVKGAILWGILGSAVLYYILAGIGALVGVQACSDIFGGISMSNPFTAFGEWGTQAFGKVFTEGFNFGGYTDGAGSLIVLLLTTALSLCMIDMFDTIGTLYGACSKGDLLDENGTPINMDKSMLADSIATCAGAIAGTSTVTTFVESSSGVAAGGKTGFTAFTTGVLFILAMFLSPIAQLIPSCATATALIWVGVLMMGSVTKIDWNNAAEAIVGFLTFIVMVLGYSINKGIGIGIIAYIVVTVFTHILKADETEGEKKSLMEKVSIPTWVIGAVYLITFALT